MLKLLSILSILTDFVSFFNAFSMVNSRKPRSSWLLDSLGQILSEFRNKYSKATSSSLLKIGSSDFRGVPDKSISSLFASRLDNLVVDSTGDTIVLL